MANKIFSVITGTGKYIPRRRIKNEDFLTNEFYDSTGNKIDKSNQEIIEKFFDITHIEERRYVAGNALTSDIASYAALDAINSAGIDREELDYIIVAHNFGDLKNNNKVVDIVPSLAARIKHKLEIVSPFAVAYDITFGCPGWVQGVIQADYFIKSGDAKKILVIGAEVLSRIYDPHDRDGMLYADGAGAVVLEARESDEPIGILAHLTRSDTLLRAGLLFMGESYKPGNDDAGNDIYLKMYGRKLYQYALEYVPPAIKACLEKSNLHINAMHKLLLHQANGKMDEAILKRLYALYEIIDIPCDVMPMTIGWLGNTSVATIPVLLDLIVKNKLEGQTASQGDILVFASVGAGMNINALTYKMPEH